MREIKFRYVWQHEETGRFVMREFSLDFVEQHPYDLKDMLHRHTLIARDEYTGLKDTNGTEICEGDVVKTLSRGWLFTGLVVWRAPGFEVDIQPSDGDGLWYGGLGDVQEVIGNIWENPETLDVACTHCVDAIYCKHPVPRDPAREWRTERNYVIV